MAGSRATQAGCGAFHRLPLGCGVARLRKRCRSAAGAPAALGRVGRRFWGAFFDYVGNKTAKVNKDDGLVAPAAQCFIRLALLRKPRLLRRCT